LPVGIKPLESKKRVVDPLEEIMENLDFKELSDQSLPDIRIEGNSNRISNYSEEDFTARYGSVSLMACRLHPVGNPKRNV
jgi:hypothetical protein